METKGKEKILKTVTHEKNRCIIYREPTIQITGDFIDGDQENEKASLKCWRKKT